MGYVDSHTHVWFKEAFDKDMIELFDNQTVIKHFSIEDIVKEMDSANLDYIAIIAYPARFLWKSKEDFPIRMANFCKRYGNRFAIIGGVEANKLSIEETKFWLEKQYEAGVGGFKIHPPHMWLKPNDYRPEERGLKQLEIVYQFASDHNLPVIIHTGTSFFPNARNKYADPIFVDDVAIDFPNLNIIMAHAGRPNWVNTAFQLIRIRKNIFADLSSIPPRRLLEYFPRIEEVKDKLLYGSDFGDPIVKSLSENLRDFLSLNLSSSFYLETLIRIPKKLIRPLV